MFKRITDERLLAKNLRNVRIAFSVQTLGILLILGGTWVTDGVESVVTQPLWIVLLVTMIVLLALTIPLARENHEA